MGKIYKEISILWSLANACNKSFWKYYIKSKVFISKLRNDFLFIIVNTKELNTKEKWSFLSILEIVLFNLDDRMNASYFLPDILF